MAMNIIIVGMRRSGTTIFFDCLYEDQRFDSYYEPFCRGKINIGGGSGARNIAFGEKLNNIRREFVSREKLSVPLEFFNLGARADFRRELEEEISPIFGKYLKFITSRNNFTLSKFVRVSYKVRALHELFPEAKIIHIVKDPRRIVVSHIFGRSNGPTMTVKRKLKRLAKRKLSGLTFFSLKRGFNNWSSENLIDFIIQSDPKYEAFKKAPAFEKLMLLWKLLYQRTRSDGLKYYASNYLEIRLEDLCNDPSSTIAIIYDFLKLSCPESVKNWACSHVKPPKPIYRPGDQRWYGAAEKVGINLDTWNYRGKQKG